MNRDPRRHLPALLLLALLPLIPAKALALTSDREKPIHIQADRVEIDEKNKLSTYQGRVELTQGSLQVTADKIVVRHGERIETIRANGAPVRFRQQPDDADYEIRGQAAQLDYRSADSMVELNGEAHLWQDKDEFSGPRIVYDAARNLVQANGSGGQGDEGRVRAVIHPRREGENRR